MGTPEVCMRLRLSWLIATIVILPIGLFAQKGNLTNQQAATQDAFVDFGVLATAPIGPAPCAQVAGQIGGPTDTCSYQLHHLTPEEVTILRNGEVTFQVHGCGDAMAIYEVSNDTTRNEVGHYLCPVSDPGTLNPASHTCLGTTAAGGTNASNEHVVFDGHGQVVLVAKKTA